jgi:hypothetical protein
MAAGPGISCAIYLTITTLYFIIKIFVPNLDNMGLFISYLCFVILGQFFVNIDITKSVCGESNFGVAVLASTIPWILVLGSMIVLLSVFPGWLIPFSNTIGFIIVAASGVGALFNEILVPEISPDSASSGNKKMYVLLEKIYNNKSLLINELSRPNLPNFWENMKKADIIDKNAGEINLSLYNPDLDKELYDGKKYENFTKLFNFIKMKDEVATYIWFVLTGTLVCSISYNYIQNLGCYKSVEQMKKTHEEYLQQEQELQDKKEESNSNSTNYRTYE